MGLLATGSALGALPAVGLPCVFGCAAHPASATTAPTIITATEFRSLGFRRSRVRMLIPRNPDCDSKAEDRPGAAVCHGRRAPDVSKDTLPGHVIARGRRRPAPGRSRRFPAPGGATTAGTPRC